MRKHIFDFIAYLRDERNVSPHTERSYLSDLEQFADFLGETEMAGVDHRTIRSFIGHLVKHKVKKSSVARKLSAIRSFFKYLNRKGVMTGNPARLVATPRREKRLPAVLTADDAQRLMNARGKDIDDDTERRDRAVLETLYSTGIRASELVGMNRDDINHDDRLVRIRGKGRKERIVPIGRTALDAIDAYLGQKKEGAENPAVFTGPRRKSLDSPDGSAYFRKPEKKTRPGAEGKPAYPPA